MSCTTIRPMDSLSAVSSVSARTNLRVLPRKVENLQRALPREAENLKRSQHLVALGRFCAGRKPLS
eukprot:6182492-Pleurochrysis_carterae.AAC.2